MGRKEKFSLHYKQYRKNEGVKELSVDSKTSGWKFYKE